MLSASVFLSACAAPGRSSDAERPRYPGPQLEWELKQRAADTLGHESTLEIRELNVDRSRQPIGVVPRAGGELLVVFGNPRKIVRTRWESHARTGGSASFSDVITTLVRPYESDLYAATERGIAVLGPDGQTVRRIPIFDTLTDFAPLDSREIAISPLFSGRSGPTIKVIDAGGILKAKWVASRSGLNGVDSPLRGAANVIPCGDKIVVAAEHEPLVAIIDRDLSSAIEVSIDFPGGPELLGLALKPEATSPAEGVKWLPTFSGGVACHEQRAFVLLALPRPVLLELDLEGGVQGRYVGPPNKAYRRLQRLIANDRGQFFAVALSVDERAYILELNRKPRGARAAEIRK